MLHAVQPQYLRIAVGKGPFSGPVGSAVVAAAFGLAGAAPDSPDVLGLHDDLHRLHAIVKVAAYRGENDDELGRVNAVKPQLRIGAVQERTDVQRGAGIRGDPALVNLHQRLDGLHKVLHGDIGHTHTVSGVIAALGVAVRAEELNLAFCGTICLQTFEDLLGVVEHYRSRIHLEGLIGNDSGVMPAIVRIIVHDKHMVGKFLAEAQFALISRLCLRGLSQFNTDIQHKRCLP